MMGRHEKGRIRVSSEVMAEDVKRAHRIAEIAGDLFRRAAINEIGSKSFVNALFGPPRLDEEFATLA